MEYFSYKYKFPIKISQDDDYSNIKLLRVDNHKAKKLVLFILDKVPSEDLYTKHVLSETTGAYFKNLLKVAKQYNNEEYSYVVCCFNGFRTQGRSYGKSIDIFKDRISKIVIDLKPDVVIGFGYDIAKAFISRKFDLLTTKKGKETNKSHWLGVPIPTTFRFEDIKHKCPFTYSLSLNDLSRGLRAQAMLSGYVAYHIASGIKGKLIYSVDSDNIEQHETVFIDTIKKFDLLMDKLKDEPYVAVDTETANLNRITNRLLTVQFAKCTKYGYVIPVGHADSPFDTKEINYIKNRLRQFFEGDNSNLYHIYANAEFDLNTLRNTLKCRFMHNSVYDIFGGEYAWDENLKELQAVTGDYYYSLLNLSIQYGFEGYLTASFGKEERATIERHKLDEDLLYYMSLDVVVPFAIHKQQLKRARDIRHTKYKSLVTEQISDMLHTFSRMSSNGSLVDIEYLMHLKTPNSPIEKEIEKLHNTFLNFDSVKKCNKLLLKQTGVPAKGLFNKETTVFSLRKNDHKQMLFFDVLGLDPINYGKPKKDKHGNIVLGSDNKPIQAKKIDKDFQKTYSDVPEVKLYTELGKAKKLKNSFVNNMIKFLKISDDFKSDRHVRSSYHYLKVNTGRTSSSDPNLQQIPARSELGKHIKRIFITEKGTLYIKVDYRVHEVRGWAIISGDKDLAKVFADAKKIRDKYRLHPTPELKAALKAKADIHVMNAMYFFSLTLEKVTEEVRDAVKSVIFGFIYQRSVRTLSYVLNKSYEYTKDLADNFGRRFKSGMQWMNVVKATGRKLYYVESPLGMRRHLWGHLLNVLEYNSKNVYIGKFKHTKTFTNIQPIIAECDRRAVNSPIQGMCAQMASIGARRLDWRYFNILRKEKRDIGIKICNSVHDSLELLSVYENLLENLNHIELALTEDVKAEIKRRHGFEIISDLEIDFEIGPALSHMKKWDFSLESLENIVYDSLIFQRDELKYKLDVDETMNKIFAEGWDKAPAWMKKQASNINWKFTLKKLKKKAA